MPISHILDSSALLALLHREPGQDVVKAALDGAAMSAVNFCEVVTKLLAIPMELPTAIETSQAPEVQVIPFDRQCACEAAGMLPLTKPLGLSLGDRACLALARLEGVPVLTTDQAWKKLAAKLGIDIRVIR